MRCAAEDSQFHSQDAPATDTTCKAPGCRQCRNRKPNLAVSGCEAWQPQAGSPPRPVSSDARALKFGPFKFPSATREVVATGTSVPHHSTLSGQRTARATVTVMHVPCTVAATVHRRPDDLAANNAATRYASTQDTTSNPTRYPSYIRNENSIIQSHTRYGNLKTHKVAQASTQRAISNAR